jgi:hypothetical protein
MTNPAFNPARRAALGTSTRLVLSAGAVGLLAGCNAMARENPAQDVQILNVALGLEHQAIAAYQLGAQGVIPSFKDAQLAKVAGRLAADETMHWTVLSNALGRMLPSNALSFGA